MKQILTLLLGIGLILLGIAGIFLPFLPGMLFIFLGLSVLAPRFASRLKMRMLRLFTKKGIFRIDHFEWSGKVKAGFTMRRFPVFMQSTDALKDPAIQAEFSKLFPGKVAFLNQVHSDGIAVLDKPADFPADGFYHFPEKDAVITNVRGLTLLVFTADCLPVFLWAGEWVGLVHAGWRGTQMQILPKTIKLMSEKSGVPASKIKVVFGPCIRRKNYEVGPEFLKIFPRSTRNIKGKPHFDLAGENRRQILGAGVRDFHVADLEIDTFAEAKDLYSFRREKGRAGRLVSFILKPI